MATLRDTLATLDRNALIVLFYKVKDSAHLMEMGKKWNVEASNLSDPCSAWNVADVADVNTPVLDCEVIGYIDNGTHTIIIDDFTTHTAHQAHEDISALKIHESCKARVRRTRRANALHKQSDRCICKHFECKYERKNRLGRETVQGRRAAQVSDKPIGGAPLHREKFESKDHHKLRTLALLAPISIQEQFLSIFEEVEQYLGTVEEYLAWEDTGWSSFLDLAREKADEGIVLALTYDIPEIADFFAEVVA